MKPKGKLALDRKALISFLDTCPDPVGKREIARAFGLRGRGRAILDDLLDGFSHPRLLGRSSSRRLPTVTVVTVSGIDDDGEALAVPTAWHSEATPPRIVLAPSRGRAPAVGDKILVRLRRDRGGEYLATEMHRIAHRPEHLLGVFRRADDGTGRFIPTERSRREVYPVSDADAKKSRPGELVRAEILPAPPRARITSRLGGGPSTIGDIVVHKYELPCDMPAAAVAEAECAQPIKKLSGREDLRELPLVTVDDADARDFDDAVWAESGPDGGWHAVVAIADVAWYVRPGSALDQMARERGNSIYLPDRVLPMLPEALSNGLCSLSPYEERPCLAVHLWLDRGGNLRKQRFVRGLMRSQARLTYDQVQSIHEGKTEPPTAAVAEVIVALYGTFNSLLQARLRRGTIELELPERRVIFGEDASVNAILPQQRHDSHRLIEEFMIAANVAAARTAEAAHGPCLYRVHDLPPADGVDELRRAARALGFHFHGGRRPADFTNLLCEASTSPRAPVINMMVLRSQAKAVYAPVNRGHFGLALDRYCHFTSPIRRYADLLVHHALIRCLGLGAGGLPKAAEDTFADIGEHLSGRERVAATAEREAVDRYAAAFMTSRIGEQFRGRIVAIAPFGLIVAVEVDGTTAAEGLVPRRCLGGAGVPPTPFKWRLEKSEFTLGDTIGVRLVEANADNGSVVFSLD